MMRELTGLVGAWSILGVLIFGGGCTPTDRNFASGGAGGTGGAGGQGGGGCPAGFTECDGNPETVCETDTATSLDNCGTCGKVCTEALDAEIACVAGTCSITSCTNGRDNCDNFYDNGCETNINTNSDHCGKCGNSCEAPDAITGCVAGSCQIANCVMGKLDCDMNAQTGCETDPTKDVNNCGMCGMACTGANAMMDCQNSVCAIAGCVGDFGDCNVEPQDGCEVDTSDDPYHCGKCGGICKQGGCRQSMCIVPEILAKPNFAPGELAIFKNNLFITSRTAGEVATIDTDTQTFAVIANASVGVTHAVAIMPGYLFLAGTGGASRMDWSGANPYSYANSTSRGIATDGSNIYYGLSVSPQGIRTAPVAGGTSATFAAMAATVYGIAYFSNNLYWGLSDGSIWSSPIGFPTPKMLGDGPNTADNLVVDGTAIYWSSISGIHSMPIAGGAITDLVPASAVRALAVDGTHLYWTEETSGLIQRVVKEGSAKPQTIAIEQSKPWGLVLTSTSIIWSNSGSGEIMRMPK